MNQDVLDRLVSLERATKVAEILFPQDVPLGDDERPGECFCEAAPSYTCWRCRERTAWESRVAQVRAAIQSTFPTPVEANAETITQETQS